MDETNQDTTKTAPINCLPFFHYRYIIFRQFNGQSNPLQRHVGQISQGISRHTDARYATMSRRFDARQPVAVLGQPQSKSTNDDADDRARSTPVVDRCRRRSQSWPYYGQRTGSSRAVRHGLDTESRIGRTRDRQGFRYGNKPTCLDCRRIRRHRCHRGLQLCQRVRIVCYGQSSVNRRRACAGL
jgi:hypothetical protein